MSSVQPPVESKHHAGGFWTAFIGHVRAAVAVGSVVTILHGAGWLGWLDGWMLRLVGHAGPVVRAQPVEAAGLPLVVLIGAELYETEFAQASPLDPLKLARLLRTWSGREEGGPSTLVIDLDLSPGPQEPDDAMGRMALDAALGALVRRGVDVVLPLPQRVQSAALQRRKFAWLQKVCAWNGPGARGRLLLGLADVVTHQGVITQFDAGRPGIGVLSARGAEASSLCRDVQDPTGKWMHALVSKAFDNRVLTSHRGRVMRLAPLNTRLFTAVPAPIVVATSLDAMPPVPGGLKDRVVFLGAAYSSDDRFMVPLDAGNVEGAVVHAAIHDSLQHPVGLLQGFGALALDVVLGIALGYGFHASWGWHQRRAAACRVSDAFSAQLAPMGSLLLNFALVLALLVGFMLLANALFYPLSLWVNPGPIVLGMFAKFVLASQGGHGEVPPSAMRPAEKKAWQLRTVLLLLLLAVASASILLHH